MEFAPTIGSALIGGVFVWAGSLHFLTFDAVKKQLAGRIPAPGLLLAGASVLEITAGLCLMAGFAKPYAAGFLILFTALASCLMLDFWRHSGPEREALRSAFAINIAVVGGLILAAAS